MRTTCIACLLLAAWVRPALAQHAEASFLAFDTIVAVDEVIDINGNNATGVLLDAVVSTDFGARLSGDRPAVCPSHVVRRVESPDMDRAGPLRTERSCRTACGRGTDSIACRAHQPDAAAAVSTRQSLNPLRCSASLPPLEPRGMRGYAAGSAVRLRGADDRVRRTLGCTGSRRRPLAAQDAPRLRADEPAALRERRVWGRDHPCRRRAGRRLDHGRRLAAGGRDRVCDGGSRRDDRNRGDGDLLPTTRGYSANGSAT